MNAKLALAKFVGTTKLWGIKNAPEILLVGAIGAGAAGLYFACKGTVDAKDVIARHKERIAEIHEAEEIADPGEFTERDVKVNMVRAYGQTAWELFKVYAPAIIFEVLSLVLVLKSHGILRQRNLVLATTLAAVRASFDEYRGRVVKEMGTEADEHFLYDTVEQEREVKVVDEKTGKEKTKKEKVKMPTKPSVYSRFYDESCDDWVKNGSANYNFVRAKMITLQDKLVSQGYLFLNDVYKALGMKITIAGQSAGWIFDHSDAANTLLGFKGFDSFGDGTHLSENVREFMNGEERNCLIDFVNLKDDILTDLPRVNGDVAIA